MDGEVVRALREAGDGSTHFDGLDVREGEDGIVLATPAGTTTISAGATIEALPEAMVPYVTNWYHWQERVPRHPPAYTFLRWLERATATDERTLSVPDRYEALADGMTRSWGQLQLTARRGEDGRRRYEIRHVRDQDVPNADLTARHDSADADDIAREDARGRYRPLKTAPTLRGGWVFPDRGPDELVAIVGTFYPATIENWYLERTESTDIPQPGNRKTVPPEETRPADSPDEHSQGSTADGLDVTHFRACADRQTGRYRSIGELSRAALTWAAEACCVDSQCLKRRRWDVDAETSIDVPRGDGEFPCREPCSLFVAAARGWVELEDEKPRHYTVELTPSEMRQLETLVDAVAEGRIDDIREGDLTDGANRYRARFLRAKRFTDGSLPAVEGAGEDSAEREDTGEER